MSNWTTNSAASSVLSPKSAWFACAEGQACRQDHRPGAAPLMCGTLALQVRETCLLHTSDGGYTPVEGLPSQGILTIVPSVGIQSLEAELSSSRVSNNGQLAVPHKGLRALGLWLSPGG